MKLIVSLPNLNKSMQQYLQALHRELRVLFKRIPNVKVFTGTTTGTTLSETHGITNLHERAVSCQVWYSNGTGTMLPGTVDSISSTVISCSGLVTTRTYRLVVFYTDDNDTNWS